jgi:hypothetical protein
MRIHRTMKVINGIAQIITVASFIPELFVDPNDGVYNTQNYWVFGLCPSSGL